MQLRALALAFLLAKPLGTFACDTAAGVVAYSEVEGQVLILIADHKINAKRGWAAFGGCIDPGETVEKAALREFHEETRCTFPRELMITKNNTRVEIGKFTSFALRVPHVDAQQISATPSTMLCSGVTANERGPWAWIPLDQLLNLFAQDVSVNIPFSDNMMRNAKHRWFWFKSARVIKLLAKQGAFHAN